MLFLKCVGKFPGLIDLNFWDRCFHDAGGSSSLGLAYWDGWSSFLSVPIVIRTTLEFCSDCCNLNMLGPIPNAPAVACSRCLWRWRDQPAFIFSPVLHVDNWVNGQQQQQKIAYKFNSRFRIDPCLMRYEHTIFYMESWLIMTLIYSEFHKVHFRAKHFMLWWSVLYNGRSWVQMPFIKIGFYS